MLKNIYYNYDIKSQFNHILIPQSTNVIRLNAIGSQKKNSFDVYLPRTEYNRGQFWARHESFDMRETTLKPAATETSVVSALNTHSAGWQAGSRWYEGSRGSGVTH